MKKTLIFDFDGTIADTHQFIIEISNKLAPEFNFKLITPENLEHLKGKTSQDMIKELNVPIMKIPAILTRAKKMFNENMYILAYGVLTAVLTTLITSGPIGRTPHAHT